MYLINCNFKNENSLNSKQKICSFLKNNHTFVNFTEELLLQMTTIIKLYKRCNITCSAWYPVTCTYAAYTLNILLSRELSFIMAWGILYLIELIHDLRSRWARFDSWRNGRLLDWRSCKILFQFSQSIWILKRFQTIRISILLFSWW